MVCSVETVHLFYVKITLSPNGQNELPLEPHHQGVPLGASKMISEPMVRLVQTMQQSYVKITLSPNGPKRATT